MLALMRHKYICRNPNAFENRTAASMELCVPLDVRRDAVSILTNWDAYICGIGRVVTSRRFVSKRE